MDWRGYARWGGAADWGGDGKALDRLLARGLGKDVQGSRARGGGGVKRKRHGVLEALEVIGGGGDRKRGWAEAGVLGSRAGNAETPSAGSGGEATPQVTLLARVPHGAPQH